MGDVVNSMNRALRNGKAWSLVLAAATIWNVTIVATPGGAAQSSEPVPPAAAPASLPATISRLAVMEGAPGTRIELVADSALVWTTYRDADGALVVELPNARPLPSVHAESVPAGLVSSVGIAVDESSDRPLTRLTIATRQDAEHTLMASQNSLHVDLVPAGTVAPPPTAAVIAASETEEPAVAEPLPVAIVASQPSSLGTPDRPVVAPPPTGRLASQLDSVDVMADGAHAIVRIAGNGEFAYSTFELQNPDRFVIDLDGVVNLSAHSSAPLEGDILARIRVSQFKRSPEAVSRVVFDLRKTVPPTIERGADGLIVRFAETGGSVPFSQISETTPEPARTLTPTAAPTLAAELAREPQQAAVVPAMPEATPPVETTVAEELAPESRQTEIETAAASDVEAYAEEPQSAETASVSPEVAAPAPAPPVRTQPAVETAPPTVAFAKPSTPRDTSQLEAADTQAAEAPRPAVAASPMFAQQPVGATHKEYVGESISLSLKDGDIKDVLRSFAKISGLNVVVQPGVRGTVTVELESVPWDQALDQILKINNLGYELDGNIMRIAPRNILEAEAKEQQALAQAQALSIPLRTVIKRISYSSVSDMARVLSTGGGRGTGILSQRGSVTVDARTNTLIIKELPTYIDTVIAVIETLDIPEPQVMIEARIVETTKRFSRTLGIRWGFDGVADAAHGNTTGLQFPNNGSIEGGVNVLTGGNNGLLRLALGNVLNTFNLDATLQAAESDGLINILSAPKIATLNNESASIQSGLQIPIQTVANNTVTVQFVNATLRLDVTPHVTAEGTVLMDVNVQKREPQIAFAVAGSTNAPISTKEAQTRVIVRDGGTTVIGGIYKVSTDQGQDRVPGLANIPLLGHLFKNRRRGDDNEELLIFITPRVIKL